MGARAHRQVLIAAGALLLAVGAAPCRAQTRGVTLEQLERDAKKALEGLSQAYNQHDENAFKSWLAPGFSLPFAVNPKIAPRLDLAKSQLGVDEVRLVNDNLAFSALDKLSNPGGKAQFHVNVTFVVDQPNAGADGVVLVDGKATIVADSNGNAQLAGWTDSQATPLFALADGASTASAPNALTKSSATAVLAGLTAAFNNRDKSAFDGWLASGFSLPFGLDSALAAKYKDPTQAKFTFSVAGTPSHQTSSDGKDQLIAKFSVGMSGKLLPGKIFRGTDYAGTVTIVAENGKPKLAAWTAPNPIFGSVSVMPAAKTIKVTKTDIATVLNGLAAAFSNRDQSAFQGWLAKGFSLPCGVDAAVAAKYPDPAGVYFGANLNGGIVHETSSDGRDQATENIELEAARAPGSTFPPKGYFAGTATVVLEDGKPKLAAIQTAHPFFGTEGGSRPDGSVDNDSLVTVLVNGVAPAFNGRDQSAFNGWMADGFSLPFGLDKALAAKFVDPTKVKLKFIVTPTDDLSVRRWKHGKYGVEFSGSDVAPGQSLNKADYSGTFLVVPQNNQPKLKEFKANHPIFGPVSIMPAAAAPAITWDAVEKLLNAFTQAVNEGQGNCGALLAKDNSIPGCYFSTSWFKILDPGPYTIKVHGHSADAIKSDPATVSVEIEVKGSDSSYQPMTAVTSARVVSESGQVKLQDWTLGDGKAFLAAAAPKASALAGAQLLGSAIGTALGSGTGCGTVAAASYTGDFCAAHTSIASQYTGAPTATLTATAASTSGSGSAKVLSATYNYSVTGTGAGGTASKTASGICTATFDNTGKALTFSCTPALPGTQAAASSSTNGATQAATSQFGGQATGALRVLVDSYGQGDPLGFAARLAQGGELDVSALKTAAANDYKLCGPIRVSLWPAAPQISADGTRASVAFTYEFRSNGAGDLKRGSATFTFIKENGTAKLSKMEGDQIFGAACVAAPAASDLGAAATAALKTLAAAYTAKDKKAFEAVVAQDGDLDFTELDTAIYNDFNRCPFVSLTVTPGTPQVSADGKQASVPFSYELDLTNGAGTVTKRSDSATFTFITENGVTKLSKMEGKPVFGTAPVFVVGGPAASDPGSLATAALQALAAAYSNRQASKFMQLVSDSYQGDTSTLDDAIRSDIKTYHTIDLDVIPSNSNANGDGSQVTVQFGYNMTLTDNQGNQTPFKGQTAYTFIRDSDGQYRLQRMDQPIIFGTSLSSLENPGATSQGTHPNSGGSTAPCTSVKGSMTLTPADPGFIFATQSVTNSPNADIAYAPPVLGASPGAVIDDEGPCDFSSLTQAPASIGNAPFVTPSVGDCIFVRTSSNNWAALLATSVTPFQFSANYKYNTSTGQRCF